MTQLINTDTNREMITVDHIEELAKAGIIPEGTPPAQVAIFMHICNEKGLSPASKQIYLVGYGKKYQMIVGIEGVRAIAARSGVHAGTDSAVFNNGLNLDDCINQGANVPRSATVTVYKVVAGIRVPFTHEVSWREFVQMYSGKPSGKWGTMPFQMLAKCAEMHALKKAFPEEMAGMVTEAEKHNLSDSYSPGRAAATKIEAEEMNPTHENWEACKAAIQSGNYTLEDVTAKYLLTNENAVLLCQ